MKDQTSGTMVVILNNHKSITSFSSYSLVSTIISSSGAAVIVASKVVSASSFKVIFLSLPWLLGRLEPDVLDSEAEDTCSSWTRQRLLQSTRECESG